VDWAGRFGIVVLRDRRRVLLVYAVVVELEEAAARVIPKSGHG